MTGIQKLNNELLFEKFYGHNTNVYNMEGFTPQVVDKEYLKNLGVQVEASDETLTRLKTGSEIFKRRMESRTVIPVTRLITCEIDPETVETEIHNYTGRCPTLTFEINPVKGCFVGCQYCLVTDGVHEQTITAYSNYHLYVRKLLKEMNGTPDREVTKDDIRKKNELLKDLAHAIESEPEKKHEIF